jgi:hypothetical protein
VTGNVTGNVSGSAATAGSATTAGTAGALGTTNFSVAQSGTELVFSFNGTRVAKLSSTGVLTAIQVQSNATV